MHLKRHSLHCNLLDLLRQEEKRLKKREQSNSNLAQLQHSNFARGRNQLFWETTLDDAYTYFALGEHNL